MEYVIPDRFNSIRMICPGRIGIRYDILLRRDDMTRRGGRSIDGKCDNAFTAL